ncbi:MAG TPA: hypothetical protein VKJ47_07810 [Candidatus Binatia bacterium]|nr:hypothetical protein [Candidatus Binatia bacterium]
MTYPNGVIVGTNESPDKDDENFYLTVVGEGRAYSVAVAANPDDEEDEPFVLLIGPFKTQQEAETYNRTIERANPAKPAISTPSPTLCGTASSIISAPG